MQVTYLGVSFGLCKLDLKVIQFCRRLLTLFSVGILLTDELFVGLLIYMEKKINCQDTKTRNIKAPAHQLLISLSVHPPAGTHLYLLMVCW